MWMVLLVFGGLGLGALGLRLALTLVGGRLNGSRWRRQQRRRQRESTIAGATEGIVRLSGTVESAVEPMVTPLSGKDAVLHHTLLHIWHGARGEIRMLEVGVRSFFIVDATGRALVVMEQPAELDLDVDAPNDCFVAADGDGVSAMVARCGVETRALHNAQVSYQQSLVTPGAAVTIVGLAAWETAPAPSVRGAQSYREPPRQLVIRPARGAVLVTPSAASRSG